MRTTGAAAICGALLVAALLATAPVQAGEEVPFKGSATATWISTDYVNLTSLFSVAGKSTHTGKITGWAVVHYDPVTYFPSTTEILLVAANGDEVYLTSEGEFDPATGTSTPTRSPAAPAGSQVRPAPAI
jgi:hypothetical protein